MSEETFLRLSRRFFSNPLWEEVRTYSRAEAWLDCLRTAAWEQHRRVIAGNMVEVKRGGLVASVRYLSDRWKWSKTKVSAFLDLLEKEKMISREKGQSVSVIYLCNFERYNPKKGHETDDEKTPRGQRKDEVEEGKEEKKKVLPAGGEAPPPKVRKPAEGDHAEFIRRWTISYPIHHDGEDYVFQGAKDGAQVARLLKAVDRTPEEWQRLFVAAWKRPDLFNCKSAASIAGFASRVNEIIAELNALHRPPPDKNPDAFKVPMNKPPEKPAHI